MGSATVTVRHGDVLGQERHKPVTDHQTECAFRACRAKNGARKIAATHLKFSPIPPTDDGLLTYRDGQPELS